MSRKARAEKRELQPDWRFGSILATKYINYLIKNGKKSVAERIFYNAIDIVTARTGQPGMEVLEKATQNCSPLLEVRARRVGGATYQIPTEVRPERRLSLAVRWIVESARDKTGKPMHERLAEEIISASKKEGAAYKKRDDVHRMAEANKAFIHLKW